MIGRLVKFSRVRSIGRRTDADLTGPVMVEHRGILQRLLVGDPLCLLLLTGKMVTTTQVERIRWLRLVGGSVEAVAHTMSGVAPASLDVENLICEVSTQNTIYRVVVVAGKRRVSGPS